MPECEIILFFSKMGFYVRTYGAEAVFIGCEVEGGERGDYEMGSAPV